MRKFALNGVVVDMPALARQASNVTRARGAAQQAQDRDRAFAGRKSSEQSITCQVADVGGECVWHEVTCNLLLPIGTGAIGHRKAAFNAVCCRRREKIVNHNVGEGARILKQVAELGELLVV
jgi:hypothetical protein